MNMYASRIHIITTLLLLLAIASGINSSSNRGNTKSLFGVRCSGGYQYTGDKVYKSSSSDILAPSVATDETAVLCQDNSTKDDDIELSTATSSSLDQNGVFVNDTAATRNESLVRQLTGGGAAGFVATSSSPNSASKVTIAPEAEAPVRVLPTVSRVRSRLMTSSTSIKDEQASQSSSFANEEKHAVKNEEAAAVIERKFREVRKAGGPLKVLFLSADTGGGHRASAEALAKHFQMYYPGTTYDLFDCWTAHGCLPYNTLVPTYKHLSAHPRQWKFLYHFSNTAPYLLCMDIHSRWSCEKKIRKGIEKYNPDVIVSVHPTMNDVPLIATEHLRKKYNKYIPFFTVVTDFGTGHCTWFRKGVDKVFVASDRLKRLAMWRAKVPEKDIVLSGLPIRRDFAVHAKALGSNRRSTQAQLYQKELRKELEIPNIEKQMVLVMGGGEGVGSLSKIVDSLYTTLRTQGIDATIIVVCGRNEELKTKLQTRDWDQVLNKNTRIKKRRHLHKLRWAVPSRRIRESLKRASLAAKEGRLNPNKKRGDVDVIGLGFVTQMADYMAASDILITKAGPGSIAEAAALGLPVMITSFLPGQEAGNVNIVLDNGFGDYCREPYGIADEIACWLQDEDLLNLMSSKSSTIGIPDAASDIVLSIGNMTHEYMELNAAGAATSKE